MPKDKLPVIEPSDDEEAEGRVFEAVPGKNEKHLDIFFKYVIHNELPAGVTVKERVGNIEGINANILKNEAIWLFNKGFNEEKLKEEIKPIYDKNGWSFNDLLGWFKKVEKGDITQINKGELYNWCKTYAPELQILLHLDKADIIELDFDSEDNERDFALEVINEDNQYTFLKQWQHDYDKYAYRQPFSALLSFHVLLGQVISSASQPVQIGHLGTGLISAIIIAIAIIIGFIILGLIIRKKKN